MHSATGRSSEDNEGGFHRMPPCMHAPARPPTQAAGRYTNTVGFARTRQKIRLCRAVGTTDSCDMTNPEQALDDARRASIDLSLLDSNLALTYEERVLRHESAQELRAIAAKRKSAKD